MRAMFLVLLGLLTATITLPVAPASAEAVSIMKLMAPGPLDEMTLGDPAAPVTMVEYASLTCPHCARTYDATFDTLKTDYIDTGKVFYVLREFPLDQLALAAAMAARCAPKEEFFPIIDTLFRDQNAWAFVDKPAPALVEKLKGHGFTEESFAACLAKTDLAQSIIAVEKRGQDEFGVDGTPSFFINGEKHTGELDLAAMEAILQPLINKP
jgi:protein-disulfide isomerase